MGFTKNLGGAEKMRKTCWKVLIGEISMLQTQSVAGSGHRSIAWTGIGAK